MSETLTFFLIALIWAINFGISWWNAYAVGTVWVETKAIGGWQRFMTWMGVIMSASGFSWCYMIALLLLTYYSQPMWVPALVLEDGEPYRQVIDQDALAMGFSLGYLILIPGILFSGFMIWIQSLVNAWRERSWSNIGVAGWNTFAQIHNTYSAMRGMPEAWKTVREFFGGKGKGGLLVLLIVIAAIIGGILTTWAIINKYAGSRALPNPQRA